MIIGWQCCGLILFVLQILFSFSSNLITFAKEKGIKQKTKLNQPSFRKAVMVLLLLLLKYCKKLLWYCIKCLARAPAATVSSLYGHSESESESHLEGRGLFFSLWSSVISCTLVLTLGRSRGGGEGWLPPSSKVILIFFLDDKTSASEVFCSSLFIPQAHSETSLVMVSYYGYEIWRDRWSSHFWVKMHVFPTIKVKLVNKMMQSNYLFYCKLKLPSGRNLEDEVL